MFWNQNVDIGADWLISAVVYRLQIVVCKSTKAISTFADWQNDSGLSDGACKTWSIPWRREHGMFYSTEMANYNGKLNFGHFICFCFCVCSFLKQSKILQVRWIGKILMLALWWIDDLSSVRHATRRPASLATLNRISHIADGWIDHILKQIWCHRNRLCKRKMSLSHVIHYSLNNWNLQSASKN